MPTDPLPEDECDQEPMAAPASPVLHALRRPPSRRTLFLLSTLAFILIASSFTLGAALNESFQMKSPADTPAGHSSQVGIAAFQQTSPAVVRIDIPGGGTGSGFFISPTQVVTAAHVVDSVATLRTDVAAGRHPGVGVTTSTGQNLTASIRAYDVKSDVALLDVTAPAQAHTLTFASTLPEVGEPVAVFGYPFGGSQTYTIGVVSSLDRSGVFATSTAQTLLIGTDAAVNPGSSGGPLVNNAGNVVGVVSIRPDANQGRPVEGLAFALPARAVKSAVDQLNASGVVSHPQLGVELGVDPTDGSGVVVMKVAPDGAAARAELQVGDTVMAVEGTTVTSPTQVETLLEGRRTGDTLKLTLDRGGRRITTSVTLLEGPA